MKKGLWNKRIPNYAAFLVLFVSIFLTSFFIQKQTVFFGRAAPDETPQNIIVSNITDNSFTVNFTTNAPSTSAVSGEGGGKSPFLVYDIRDKNGQNGEYESHFITVSNLSPNTTYTFSILSNGDTYLNNGQKYLVKTGPVIEPSLGEQKLSGKVLSSDGSAASGAIVELMAPGAQIVTTLSDAEGKFAFYENAVRNESLDKSYIFDASKNAEVKIFLGPDQADANISLGSSTIAPITLAQDYDFTNIQSQISSTGSSQLKAPEESNTTGQVKITVPRAGQAFVDNRPQFSGLALPGSDVKITIQSNPITTTVKASNQGVWTYRPTVELLPGSHTITIQSVDTYGIIITATQTFSVFASGSQVTESATPSATPRPSPTKTPTPIPSATLIPTKTPSATPTREPSVSPSPTPTVAPTIIPTATVVPTILPTTQPTIAPTAFAKPPSVTPPPTGSTGALVLTTVSVLLIFAGATLLFIL